VGVARIARRGLLPLLATPMLAACGFRPVYGPVAGANGSPAAQALAEISVGIIPERSGQLLRLALQERFERAGIATAHQYDLNVSFGISAEAIAFEQNSASTWTRVEGTAVYKLVAQDPSRATVTSGAARSVDGYNLFDQQFFTADLEAEAVQRRITQAVADQIALQLASFFAKRAAGSTG
jgi:LPS-assembly lipoprotein